MAVKSEEKSGVYKESRLPSYIKPHHYDLNLKPNLKDFTFSGTVKIHLTCKQQVNEIILNANDLKIHNGYLEVANGPPVDLKKVIYNREGDVVVLKFEEDQLDPRLLVLHFTGILNDKMKGFYRSSFKLGNQTVNMATTQFEATDARRSFPCFDEPALKATFQVTLVYDATPVVWNGRRYPIIALSNGCVIGGSSKGNEKTTTFETTPKMSTYLLAYIIGPLEFIENVCPESRCKVRVYTTPGKVHQAKFALEVACRALDWYVDYFYIKYPLTKLDLVAIPDFASGAMENWGLVTYRETALLLDPSKSSSGTKQWIAIVVAHELAHQWFGNLVTMEWWTHLWLNEGFACFMESYCVESLYPELKVWEQFVTGTFVQALESDSLDNSHPIEVVVNKASQIDEIFDNISYNKGASIIRMLHDHIGPEKFREGLQRYLLMYSFGNAVTEDLWDCFRYHTFEPISEFMSPWTSQMGYPWLKIESEQKDSDLILKLTQNKFSANGNLQAGDEKMKWTIPLSLKSSSPHMKSMRAALNDVTHTFVLPKIDNHWVKLNVGAIGFYRCGYDSELLARLTKAIEDNALEPVDRLNVLNDCLALCQAGNLPTTQLLNLLLCFDNETEFIVWSTIDMAVGSLSKLYLDTEFSDPFKALCRQMYSKIYSKVGWTKKGDESHTESMLRCLVINRLLTSYQDEVIKKALAMFKAQMNDNQQIPADLKAIVYRAAAIHGDDEDFNNLFHIFRTEELHEEKNRAAQAICCAKSPQRLERAIEFAFSSEIRIQDVHCLAAIGSTHPAVAWKLFQERKEHFKKNYTAVSLMNTAVKCCTGSLKSEDKAQEIEKYFKKNSYPGTERTVKQCLEKIRLSAAWIGRQRSDNAVMELLLRLIKP